MKEGIAHFLQLCDVVAGDNLLTVLHGGGNLRNKVAKFVNSGGNLVEGAVLEVIDSGFQVSDEGIDVLDARDNVGNALSLKCTNEDTFDDIDHVDSSAFFITSIEIEDIVRFTAPVSTLLAIGFAFIAKIASGPERAFSAAQIGAREGCYAAVFTSPGFSSHGKKGESEVSSHLGF